MNSMQNTIIYEALNTVSKGELDKRIRNENDELKMYIVDREFYDYLIYILKSWNSDKVPLVKFVIKDLQNENIKPILSIAPKEFEHNGKRLEAKPIPSPIPAISIIDKGNGRNKLVTLFDTLGSGSYVFNKTTHEIESFNCDARRFYGMALRGFLSRSVCLNNIAYNTNVKFVKVLSSLFARLFSVAMSGQLGGSSRGDWMQRINYIALVYALQNFFDYPMEKARNIAFAFQSVDKAYIIENCRYYNFFNESDPNKYDMSLAGIAKNYANVQINKRPKPMNIFIDIISKEFSDMRRDKLEYRTVANVFTNRYGYPSILALEHALSFLILIVVSDSKANMFNDLAVLQQAEPFLDDLYDALYSIVSRS